jgi:hypothetical protein
MFDPSNLYVGRSARKGHAQSAQDANAARIEQLRQDAESVTVNGFLANERLDEAARLEAEQAPIRAAEAELNRNMSELHKAERENFLKPSFVGVDGQAHHYEDPHILYDPAAPEVFYSEAELNAYNKEQVRIFLQENPSYFPDMAGKNQDTIFKYLSAHGISVIVSAKMIKGAFERLTYLGMMIPRPAESVTAPAPVRVVPAPAKQKVWNIEDIYTGNSVNDLFEGFDPHGTGQRIRLTARQIDKLTLDEYKTFSRVTVQEKPSYARMEDRDPDYLAEQFVNLGQGR